MREQDFLNNVVDLAHLRGWKVHHSRPAWTGVGWRTALQGDPGCPDLLLVRKPRVILSELKSEKGKISDVQTSWVEELKGCPGIELYLWRPDDWNEIVKMLR